MHNLKVAGSNPAPATAQTPGNIDVFGVFDSRSACPSGLSTQSRHVYAGHELGKSKWRQRFEVPFPYRGAELFLKPAATAEASTRWPSSIFRTCAASVKLA